jgi:hypothetical protein
VIEEEEAHGDRQQERQGGKVRMKSPCAWCQRAEERRARAQKRARAHAGGLGRVLYLPPNKRHNKPRLTSSISQTEGAKACTSLLYAWTETEREEGECEQG